jgi:sugar phosphate isomerase/epimerase
MRLRHPSGRIVHLSHAIASRQAVNLPAVVARLDTCAAARVRLGADLLGVNLWLPPALAAALAVDGRSRTRLRAELDARGLEVVTLSGAPFAEGGGEQQVSGDSVAALRPASQPAARPADEAAVPPGDEPGWDRSARREYTLDLARILLDLLPEDAVRGAVGTVGLGRREDWNDAAAKASTGVLRRLSAGLADLAWQNGRAVRVGFQPADGFVLDGSADTVAALGRIDKDRLGVSLDLGHVAQTWHDPVADIEAVTDAGLSIIEVRLVATATTTTGPWRAGLRHLLGPGGPLTEYLTLTTAGPDPSAEQLAADVAYLLSELSALGLAPENESCVAR